jgi:hypothetical protein
MKVLNKILVVIFALTLTGCSLFGGTKSIPPVEVEKRVQPIPIFHPPLPEKVTWQEVKWKVLTPETIKEYLKDLEEGNAPVTAWYALTPESYRALSENVGDIQRYIKQQNALIVYYRENLVEIVVEQVEKPKEEKKEKTTKNDE